MRSHKDTQDRRRDDSHSYDKPGKIKSVSIRVGDVLGQHLLDAMQAHAAVDGQNQARDKHANRQAHEQPVAPGLLKDLEVLSRAYAVFLVLSLNFAVIVHPVSLGLDQGSNSL